MRAGDTPVPIPNTTVKTWAADGTALETVWESRWMPDPLKTGFTSDQRIEQKFSFLDNSTVKHILFLYFFLRKEVIQPHLPIRLPCYDFTPVIGPAFGSSFLAVRSLTSGVTDSHGVTGGVYKTRERIHRGILIRDY